MNPDSEKFKLSAVGEREKRILNLLWENSALSRCEIAEKAGLTNVSITKKIEALINDNILIECAGVPTARGRRPVPLRFRPDLFFSIGITFCGPLHSKVSIINAHAEVIAEKHISGVPHPNWKRQCDAAIKICKALLKEKNIPDNKLIGIGIALSGIFDPIKGQIISSSQFPRQRGINIAEYFEMKTGFKPLMMNVSHLSAILENRMGNAVDMKSFLTLCTGFGLGIFLNGHLYRGHQYNAGELGMVQIQPFGEKRAVDGRCGTLGLVAPFYKITDELENIVKMGGNSNINKYFTTRTPEGKIPLEAVVEAISNGDALCAKMMSEHFEILSQMILNLAYIFNPEAIFLPAWTAKCPHCTLEIVLKTMEHYSLTGWGLSTKVMSASCSDEMFATGAALLPIDEFFKTT